MVTKKNVVAPIHPNKMNCDGLNCNKNKPTPYMIKLQKPL